MNKFIETRQFLAKGRKRLIPSICFRDHLLHCTRQIVLRFENKINDSGEQKNKNRVDTQCYFDVVKKY